MIYYQYVCKKNHVKSLNGPDFYVVGDTILIRINDKIIDSEYWDFVQKLEVPNNRDFNGTL